MLCALTRGPRGYTSTAFLRGTKCPHTSRAVAEATLDSVLRNMAGLRVNNELGLRPQYSLHSSSVLDSGLTLTRTVLEAAHHCPRSTTNPVRQVVVTALRRRTCEVRAILHAGKQSHSQGGVVHTEEGDVPYWAHCVVFYDFWQRENSLEKKLRCGKTRRWNGRI